ncbi:MAG TPA: 30S ribosome-binding factor RbfA [Clostridia bacterium]|nr:30S ribosome-binding factor RbfA [Clostridia bacterium]
MIRIERVNSEMQKQIAFILDNGLKNPLIKSGMLTVTRVKTTPDLKYAKVFLSIFCLDEDQKKEIFKAVEGAAGFIRNQLKGTMKIRALPDLQFTLDDSIDYSIRIDKILKSL